MLSIEEKLDKKGFKVTDAILYGGRPSRNEYSTWVSPQVIFSPNGKDLDNIYIKIIMESGIKMEKN